MAYNGRVPVIDEDDTYGFYVQLPNYENKTWRFDPQDIEEKIPESLLARTLEVDPDVSVLRLEHPDVTPEGLDAIADFLNGRLQLWKYSSSRLVSNYRYLGADILGILASSKSQRIPCPGGVDNLTDVKLMQKNYYCILSYAIRNNLDLLFYYIYPKIVISNPKDLEGLINLAIRMNRLDYAEYLRK